MFWDNYYNLCLNNGISPNAAAKEMKISSGAVTEWKKGRLPQMATIKKIAEYFGVSVADLTAENSTPTAKTLSPDDFTMSPLTPHEINLMKAYRDQPEMQPAVDRLLGITEDGYVTVYAAANSASNHKHTITRIPQEKWAEIENEPNTDEDLM